MREFGSMDRMSGWSVKKIVFAAVGAVLGLFILLTSGKQLEYVDSDEIVVIQGAMSGNLHWYQSAGPKLQLLGKVTSYPKRHQFWFTANDDEGDDRDQSIRVRFNEGGHANISGSLSWEMPTDMAHLKLIREKYPSLEKLEGELLRPLIEKSVYMSGALMSSKESAGERRTELLHLIEDQIVFGVYTTETEEVKEPDPITGQPKTVRVVRIVKGENGQPVREDTSPIGEFGIRAYGLSVKEIAYDSAVESQITSQQKLAMSVQTSQAEAKQAEQAAITAEKNGQAEAAKAKWAMEVEKAKEVTTAEKKVRVAELATQEAEQYKRAQILKAEGDAEYKRRVMQADGALAQKLATYEKVMGMAFKAVAEYKGQWVPGVLMGAGSSNGTGASSAFTLMDMLAVKAAKDLSLDMRMASGGSSGGQ